jgi:hypothetical protein
MTEQKTKLPKIIGRILCFLGEHDYRVVSVTMGFSYGDTIEKVECKRCQYRTTRLAEED